MNSSRKSFHSTFLESHQKSCSLYLEAFWRGSFTYCFVFLYTQKHTQSLPTLLISAAVLERGQKTETSQKLERINLLLPSDSKLHANENKNDRLKSAGGCLF